LFLGLAHAGWFDRLCESFIAEDPYQFEQAPDAYIAQEIARLRIKQAWGRCDRHELKMIDILERETNKRILISELNDQADVAKKSQAAE
jgi:hypothetical protein